jgi:hypothetical protein
MRVISKYAITWLKTSAAPPTNDWRDFRNAGLRPLKIKNLPHKGKVALPHKGKADGVDLPHKGKADTPKNLPHKGKVLSRSSYQGGSEYSELSVADGGAAALALRVVNGRGS